MGRDRLELGNGLALVVRKHPYTGLWEIRYDDGALWGGPWRTRREAREHLEQEREDVRSKRHV